MSKNLLLPQSSNALKIMQQDLSQKLQSTNLSIQEKHAYSVALGLVYSQQENFSQSTPLLQTITDDSYLWLTAQFFVAENYRHEGERALAQSKHTAANDACKSADNTLTRISKLTNDIIQENYERSFLLTQLCLAKTELAAQSFASAKQKFESLMRSSLMGTSKEKNDILKGAATIYLKLNDVDSLRFLAKKYATNFEGKPEFQTALAAPSGNTTTPAIAATYPNKGELSFSSLFPHPADKLFNEARDILAFDKIVRQYPLSDAALKASAKMDILIVDYAQKPTTPEMLTQLKQLNPDSLYKAGQELWNVEKSKEAFSLYKEFYTTYPFDSRAVNALFFSARLYEDQKLWKDAREIYKEVILKYPNSNFSERSLFKVGFMSFLAEDYTQAVIWLEQYRARVKHVHQQAEALYWLMSTSIKNNKPQEADAYKKEIAKIAPLSYYAFLTQQFPKLTADVPLYPTRLSPLEVTNIEKALGFLMCGLPTYAQPYIAQLDTENKAELALLLAKLHNDAKSFTKSFSLSFEMLNQNSVNWDKNIASLFFPSEFETEIALHAKNQQLDPAWVQSLIKQESAFNPAASSRVGATGLMQLMPYTAEAVSKEHNVAYDSNEELTQVDLNLQLGTKYFASLVKDFNQKVPLALAGYNGGPKRVASWNQRWKDLPMDQFIELIPLDETRNYVKYILRNYAYYKLLKGEAAEPEKIFIK